MDNETNYVTGKEWAKVYARAWQDSDFKDKLERDPAAALKELGITRTHIAPIPPRPTDLTESQLSTMEKGETEYHAALSC